MAVHFFHFLVCVVVVVVVLLQRLVGGGKLPGPFANQGGSVAPKEHDVANELLEVSFVQPRTHGVRLGAARGLHVLIRSSSQLQQG